MEESRFRGKLADIPFAQLLFHIWKSEKSGYLKISKEKSTKRFYIESGRIAVELSSFPEKDFLQTLADKNLLNSSSLAMCRSFASQNNSTLIKALLELNTFSPSRLWKLLEAFLIREIQPLFDWADGEYSLNSENLPQNSEILLRIQTLNFILRGVRKMKNIDVIKAHLPVEDSAVHALKPSHLNQIELEPPEKYLLHMIEEATELKTIYERSELGKKETQRILFGLLSLSLIGFPQEKTQENAPQKSTQARILKILDAFNSKCSYIYKYISKEIGPVALNVLEKCQEEIMPCLSLPFQKIKLRADGRMDISPLLQANMGIWSEEDKKNLIKDLNEILAAEVLAVKKTLGNEHEAVLVKNLEKIGEWN